MTETECKKAFANRLRELLVESGLTQLELSKRSGVTRWSLERYLKGETSPRIEDLDKLATGLGVVRALLVVF